MRESFALRSDESGKILEQIDGVVEIDQTMYLVELKWWGGPVGVPEISQHLSRIFLRARGQTVRGIVISYSGYTEPAITTAKEALSAGAIVFLCKLADVVSLLEGDTNLLNFCRDRIKSAIIDKSPFIG